jgi:hypothetical protein
MFILCHGGLDLFLLRLEDALTFFPKPSLELILVGFQLSR